MEHYQPEFVVRYLAENADCACPHCLSSDDANPLTSIKFNNQQRDSLDVTCESAARQMLLNPDAFVLHAGKNDEIADAQPDIWLETLNQECLNLAMHPALTVELSLFAIGILLSRVQQYQGAKANDPALLVTMAQELCLLAEQGVLAQQYVALPQIGTVQTMALKSLGAKRMSFNLPPMEKMAVALKIGELKIMNDAQLVDRASSLQTQWNVFKTASNLALIYRNVLIYKLYTDIFPGKNDVCYGEKFLRLTQQFFQLKMLFAIWAETGNELTDDIISSLYISLQSLGEDVDITINDEEKVLYALALI
jgi:lysine-N-methylase